MRSRSALLASLALSLLAGCGGSVRRFPLRDATWRDTDLDPISLECERRPTEQDPAHVACAPEPMPTVFPEIPGRTLGGESPIDPIDPGDAPSMVDGGCRVAAGRAPASSAPSGGAAGIGLLVAALALGMRRRVGHARRR